MKKHAEITSNAEYQKQISVIQLRLANRLTKEQRKELKARLQELLEGQAELNALGYRKQKEETENE